jgi:uncharacterized protein
MPTPELKKWSGIFGEKAKTLYPSTDPSHDLLHISRVVKAALRLAGEEGADMHVVLPAAYFHDFINVPKDDPRRKEASRLSATAAVEYLAAVGYPARYFDAIRHAIAAHSFSANIRPETPEAKVVQDADRLDGLGAIGIARCFSTSSLMRRPYYCPDDVWGEARELDDGAFAIDHFQVKLFKIAETMQTPSARLEARQRVDFMRLYLQQLKSEI